MHWRWWHKQLRLNSSWEHRYVRRKCRSLAEKRATHDFQIKSWIHRLSVAAHQQQPSSCLVSRCLLQHQWWVSINRKHRKKAQSDSHREKVTIPASHLQISFMASCPCLSDRRKFPTFFRTIPSDVDQAQPMARLALRFRWSWIGAVALSHDYGRLAIQVGCQFQCFKTSRP